MRKTDYNKVLADACGIVAQLDTTMTNQLPEGVSVHLENARSALASAVSLLSAMSVAGGVVLSPEKIKAVASSASAQDRKDLLRIAASVEGLSADPDELAAYIETADVSRDDTSVKFDTLTGGLVADVDCDFSVSTGEGVRELRVCCKLPIPSACVLDKKVADEIEDDGLGSALESEVTAATGTDTLVSALKSAGFTIEDSDEEGIDIDVYGDGSGTYHIAPSGDMFLCGFADGKDPKGIGNERVRNGSPMDAKDVVYFAKLIRTSGAEHDAAAVILDGIHNGFASAGISDAEEYVSKLTCKPESYDNGSRSSNIANFNNSKKDFIGMLNGEETSPYVLISRVRHFTNILLTKCKQDDTATLKDKIMASVSEAITKANKIMTDRKAA